jgi:serine acetyltransferase
VIDPSARIHSSADLEADVSVGPGSTIWHHAQVRTGARIGAQCVIGRDVFIDEGVQLGDRVKVQNRALVYHGVSVEDGVFIGPAAILTNDRYPRAITASGELARSDDWTVSPILLRTGSSIGAGAVVVGGTTVGRFATVGAGAVIVHDVPDHALVAGNPARRLGWVCACGRRLLERDGKPASADGPSRRENPAPDGSGSLHCGTCGRTYDYAADGGSISQRTGLREEVSA